MPAAAPPPRTAAVPVLFWESRAALALGTVVLVAALLAAYANSFRVPFLLDDTDSITLNPSIEYLSTSWLPPSDSGITTSGRPLLNVSLAINHALHGTDVFGYHVGNLLIHAFAALTLWAVLRRTLRQPALAPRFGVHATPLAWCAATLWALHPLQTESVTYIIQRAESLVGLFYLLTLYGFLRSVEKTSATSAPHDPSSPAPRPTTSARSSSAPIVPATRRLLWPVFTVVSCLCGMASKEVMASAPLIVFLYDRTFVSGTFAAAWRNNRKLHLSLAATWLMLLACIIQSGGRGNTVGYLQVAWWEYALTQAPAITGYLWRAIWPANLIFDYGAIVEKTPSIVIPSTVFMLSLLGAAIYALRRHPVAGFAFAWFFLILAPTSSIVPVATQTVAEHRMYLPLATLVISAALLLYRWQPRIAFPLLALLLAAAALRTHSRNHDYRSSLAIWEATARQLPDSARALNNHGSMLLEAGRTQEAMHQFQTALEYVPHFSEAWHNLGCALLNQKKYPGAIDALSRAVKLAPSKALYHSSLGNAFSASGAPLQAAGAYQRACELEPKNATHVFNLATTLMKLERMDESGRLFAHARELAPDDPEIMIQYAIWLRRNSRPADAIPLMERALRLDPRSANARSNLGISLLEAGRTADGLRELETALTLDPDLAQTRYHLGTVFAENGRPADAIPHFEALIKLKQPSAEILDNLGTLYAQTGRYDDAVATFQKALALDPQHRNARRNLEAVQAFLRGMNTR